MKKQFAASQKCGVWPTPAIQSQLVMCGDMVWVSGQVATPPQGEAFSKSLAKQLPPAMLNPGSPLPHLGYGQAHVKLLCVHVNDGSLGEDRVF